MPKGPRLVDFEIPFGWIFDVFEPALTCIAASRALPGQVQSFILRIGSK